MDLKSVITLLLGLVFQLSQVLPAAATNAPCVPHAASCCCKASKSCHCATNGESDQKPAPAPVANETVLKVTAAKPADARVCLEPLVESVLSSTSAITGRNGPFAGFHGVRLSVALRRIVI